MGEAPISIIGKAQLLFFLRCLSASVVLPRLNFLKQNFFLSLIHLSLLLFFIFFFREILSFFTRAAEDNAQHNTHSQDTRSRARISNTPGDHFGQLYNKSLHSKDIRFRARISNTPGDHVWQPKNKSIHPTNTRFRAHISNTRGDHL